MMDGRNQSLSRHLRSVNRLVENVYTLPMTKIYNPMGTEHQLKIVNYYLNLLA